MKISKFYVTTLCFLSLNLSCVGLNSECFYTWNKDYVGKFNSPKDLNEIKFFTDLSKISKDILTIQEDIEQLNRSTEIDLEEYYSSKEKSISNLLSIERKLISLDFKGCVTPLHQKILWDDNNPEGCSISSLSDKARNIRARVKKQELQIAENEKKEREYKEFIKQKNRQHLDKKLKDLGYRGLSEESLASTLANFVFEDKDFEDYVDIVVKIQDRDRFFVATQVLDDNSALFFWKEKVASEGPPLLLKNISKVFLEGKPINNAATFVVIKNVTTYTTAFLGTKQAIVLEALDIKEEKPFFY